MEETSRNPVLERLQELEGWAEYITEALHLDQKGEPVRREMLERTVEERSLREVRELSWRLRDRLHLLTTQLELSRPMEIPMR
jgi:hypothetical protein